MSVISKDLELSLVSMATVSLYFPVVLFPMTSPGTSMASFALFFFIVVLPIFIVEVLVKYRFWKGLAEVPRSMDELVWGTIFFLRTRSVLWRSKLLSMVALVW